MSRAVILKSRVLLCVATFAACGLALVARAAGPNDFRAARAHFIPQAGSRLYELRQRPQEQVALEPVPSRLQPGSTFYVSVTRLIRGQEEISVDNTLSKLRERVALNDVRFDETSGEWKLAHHEGRSSVPLNDPLLVVVGPQGYVVADGHHDLYLALYLGARTVPVQVLEDLSALSPVEFWRAVQARKLVLLTQTPEELAANPPDTAIVRDNPNRYLAALLALKVKTHHGASGELEIKLMKGAKRPAWLKVDGSVPFIEFELAAILARAGIQYDPAWGEAVPDEVIDRAIEALGAHDRELALRGVPVLKAVQAREVETQGEQAVSVILQGVESGCAHLFGGL